MAKTLSLYDAKTNLSALVEEAAAGEEIVIAKNGKPRARLVPLAAEPGKRRQAGLYKAASGSPTTSTPPGRKKSAARWRARTRLSPTMRLLLDSHAFLWSLTDSPRLSRRADTAITGAKQVWLSHLSIWSSPSSRPSGD